VEREVFGQEGKKALSISGVKFDGYLLAVVTCHEIMLPSSTTMTPTQNPLCHPH